MAKKNILTQSKKAKAEAAYRNNQLAEAQSLYEMVCRADRLDAEAWSRLAVIYRKLRQYGEAERCARQALALQPQSAEAHHALGAALQCQGRMPEAIASYQAATRLRPDFAEAHYFLANLHKDAGDMSSAEIHYKEAIALRSDYLEALSNLGAMLRGMEREAEATEYLNRALALNPKSPPVLCNMALLLESTGYLAEARPMLQQALIYDPDFVDALMLMAELEEKANHLDEAKVLVERGLRIDPENVSLNQTAAKIARSEKRFQDAIDILERLDRQPLKTGVSGTVKLSLGTVYDRVGDAERAFAYWAEGNRRVAEAVASAGRDLGAYRRRVSQMAAFLTDDLAAAPNILDDRPTPAFLMGFPRSGTTLLEQVLDSHPGLQALDERPTIESVREAFTEMAGERLDALAALDAQQLAKLRNVYWDTASRYVKLKPGNLLVDKMPLHTANIHLIWRLFPQAKIILAIRHPCDVCLSCFMQTFAVNDAMSTFYTLEDTAGLYSKVMGLWRQAIQKLPLDYHRIRYEDLVADFEGESRRLLDFLGVGWDDAVLGYDRHAKSRLVKTASYHQVTQPIYQHAKYRWKRYEKQMTPVMEGLRPYIEYFGYGDV